MRESLNNFVKKIPHIKWFSLIQRTNLSFLRRPSTKFSFFNFSNISTYQISGSLGIEIRNYLLFSHYFHRIAIVFWLHPATLLSSSLGYGSCSGHLWSSKKLSDPYGIFFSPVFQSIVTGSLAKTFLSSSVFLLVAKVPCQWRKKFLVLLLQAQGHD